MTSKVELHRGSLDYDEYVMDPKNPDSTPAQLGDALADTMETLDDEDWSMVRFVIMKLMQKVRRKAERKAHNG